MSESLRSKIVNYFWIPIVYVVIFIILLLLKVPISDSIGSIIIGLEGWEVDPQLGSVIIGVFLVFFSFAAFSYFYRAYLVGKASMMWPTVEGEVVTSGILGSKAVNPRVVFSYIVDGIKYISNAKTIGDLYSISFSSTGSARAAAEQIVQNYPVGKKITVYYNPNKLERKISRAVRYSGMDIDDEYTQDAKIGNAVLIPGYSTSKAIGGLVLGFFLAIIGEPLLFVGLLI